jgi:hypothetical protein
MAYAAVFLLVFAYGALAPLGLRIRWAERRLLLALVPPDASSRGVEGVRNVINRGWPSLVASELWLLLLLAACIGVFLVWWFLLVLPVLGWGLARLLDRLDPYPRTLDWYLGQFLNQADAARARAVADGDDAGAARIVLIRADMETSRTTLGGEAVRPSRR